MEDGDDEELDGELGRNFRGVAARLNYLAQDSPDLQYPTKEVCRGMSKPTVGDWRRMKKLARFLINRKRVIWKYRWQEAGRRWKVYTDSDWAGCKRTRKSSSGGVAMIGDHCLKVWSSTQGALALSSAEAEYYSMVEGVIRMKGLQAIGRELGVEGSEERIALEWIEGKDGVEMELLVDSSAAKSFVSRRGMGKMRHMEVKWFWLQEEVKKGKVVVLKVKGEKNPADIVTKYLTMKELKDRLSWMGLELLE